MDPTEPRRAALINKFYNDVMSNIEEKNSNSTFKRGDIVTDRRHKGSFFKIDDFDLGLDQLDGDKYPETEISSIEVDKEGNPIKGKPGNTSWASDLNHLNMNEEEGSITTDDEDKAEKLAQKGLHVKLSSLDETQKKELAEKLRAKMAEDNTTKPTFSVYQPLLKAIHDDWGETGAYTDVYAAVQDKDPDKVVSLLKHYGMYGDYQHFLGLNEGVNLPPFMDPAIQDNSRDTDGDMAQRQIKAMIAHAEGLCNMVEADSQIESWVQAKITTAANAIAEIYHYMEYEKGIHHHQGEGEDSEVVPVSKVSDDEMDANTMEESSREGILDRVWRAEYEDFYVVNKKLNDKNLSSGSPINYDERPFAQKFNSWEEALKNATPEDEIETPEGDVYGFEDGKWVVVFT